MLAASSGIEALLHPHNLAPEAIVCDVSVPSAVAAEVSTQRPDVTVLRGGLARLPAGEKLAIPNFPLPPGQVFGCMAEGILLGAAGIRNDFFSGSMTPEHVERISEIATQHHLLLDASHNTHLFGD